MVRNFKIVHDTKKSTSVIIGTLAQTSRKNSLKRAIESIRLSSVCPVQIIVVVNGDRFDPEICDWLKTQSDVLFSYIEEPSLPLALLKGRQLVETEFFSFLDDDDEYLPGATDHRLACLRANPETDLLVCNGYRSCGELNMLVYDNLAKVSADPLYALLNKSWLASCGGLFRTHSIKCDFFYDGMAYLEWTWLSFRIISAGHRVQVLDDPTFIIHDTPNSASKSEKYLQAHISLNKRMLDANPRPDLIPIIRRRLANAWHSMSDYQRTSGNIKDSWLNHLQSLSHPSGWRYWSYTARLLASSLAFSHKRK